MKEAGAIQIEKKKHRMDMWGLLPPEKKISHGKRCGRWRNQKAKERFYKLEQMFLAGKTDSDFYGEIVPTELYAGADTSIEKALHWKNTLRSMGFQATGSTR